MQLSRDAIQRMIGRTGSGVSVSGGGGEGGGISADFLTQNYVAIPYFSQLFTIHGKQTTTVDGEVTDEQDITFAPNTMPSRTETTEGGVTTVVETTITRIEALFDFNSVGGVSALGYNPGGGGGGGADLNALLDNINSSNIGDIAPGASEVGKCLVYNGNNQWAWATPGGGGGRIDNVSVSSAGLLTGGSISGSSIILNTRAIQASDLPDLSATYVKWTNVNRTSYSSWDKIPFVNSSGSMDIGKTLEFHSSDGDSTDYNAVLMLDSSKTYNAVALTLPNTSGTLATQSWVNSQGFVKSSGVTSVGLSMPTGFSVSDSPVTSSGTLSVGIASGYFIPTTTQRTTWNNKQDAISDLSTIRSNATNGQAAYTKINAATWWGKGLDANNQVKGGLQYVEYIEFNNTSGAGHGGHLDFHFNGSSDDYTSRIIESSIGKLSINSVYMSNGNAVIGESTTDTSHYLQIGGGRIYWDNQSKSLYVVQSDGSTPANIYATGGVSALGISTGGSPSVSALTVGTLTATTLNMSGDMNANGGNLDMDSGDIDNVNHLSTSSINVNGTTISRIYWNGTYLQVQIGSNTYNFRPV